MLNGKQKLTPEEKEMLREKKLRIKDKYERNNLGDFEIMYPLTKGVSDE